MWSHGIDTRECGEQVAEHYDTAVVNFAGIKYPLKIYPGGKTRKPVLAVSVRRSETSRRAQYQRRFSASEQRVPHEVQTRFLRVEQDKICGCYLHPLKFCQEPRKPVWSHGIDTRECGEQVAEHYDTAVVNFAGIKYPLKIYSGGKTRKPVLAVSVRRSKTSCKYKKDGYQTRLFIINSSV